VAEPAAGSKLHAPAAARNADALVDLLRAHAPASGAALEIASGTGQHIVRFAAAFPDIQWQPSEIEPQRRASIDAYAADAGLENVSKAVDLDAAAPGWSQRFGDLDLVVLINLLHLIPATAVRAILSEVSHALADTGVFIFYGPFKRDGQLTSAGDRRFDAELRTADPAIGYKDILDMERWLSDVGLELSDQIEMPANNLALITRKPI
jgi:SAM-dependent methyltransferase